MHDVDAVTVSVRYGMMSTVWLEGRTRGAVDSDFFWVKENG